MKNKREARTKKPRRDLKGQIFGKLEVLDFSHFRDSYPYWLCKCECGNEKAIYQQNLLSGRTSSCGCTRRECGVRYCRENLHIYQGIQIEKAIAKSTQRNNTSGFRGVFKDSKTGKFRARIISQGVRTELGYFQHLEDAIEARLKAEEKRNEIIEEYKLLQSLAKKRNIEFE